MHNMATVYVSAMLGTLSSRSPGNLRFSFSIAIEL